METQKPINEDWRKEITENKEVLKISDGQTVEFTFMDEGQKIDSEDYGVSIVFTVLNSNNEKKRFFVRGNNFDLLSQIKSFGTLSGLKVLLSRTGSRRSDTRYKIRKS